MNRLGGSFASLMIVASFFLTSGCAKPIDRGHVAKEWALAMRELQIVPVFPPREDVQIGDVYIVPARPEDEAKFFEEKGYLPRGLWVHTVELNKLLSKFYEKRPDFPSTGDSPMTAVQPIPGDTLVRPAVTKQDGVDVYSSGTNSRLRMVGFPSFLSATFTQGDLGSFIPVEAGAIAGSAGFKNAKSVSVKVPVAESCALPANLVIRSMRAEAENLVLAPDAADDLDAKRFNPFEGIGDFVPKDIRTFLNDEDGEPKQEIVRVRIATEVFYARVVEVTMRSEESKGGMFDWFMSPKKDNRQGGGQRGDVPPKGSPGDPDAKATADRMKAQLNRAQPSVPGLSLSYVTANENSIGMRRVYEKPVAIGFRGFDVDIILDAKTGEYVDMKPVGVTTSVLARTTDFKATPDNSNKNDDKKNPDDILDGIK